jgi:hypothetical protein
MPFVASQEAQQRDKRMLALAAKRHPTTMMRQSSVWEFVDRSSLLLEKARQGA